MTDRELRDQLVTMLLAGHETTATAIAWAVERLTRNPDVMRTLVARLDEGDTTYLDAVIKETLRSRPVVAQLGRVTTEEVVIDGWTIPPRTMLIVPMAVIHQDPELYPEPNAFRPERFTGDTGPGRYSWLPFGGGTRRCPGASLALLEMRVILSTILRNVELEPERPEPEARQGARHHRLARPRLPHPRSRLPASKPECRRMTDLAQRVIRAAAGGAGEPEDELAVAVLDAALRQFEVLGIAKSSVEDIARRANVARVTVYRRFPGKDAVVEAVILRELRRFQADLAAAVAPFDDPEDQLVEGFVFTVRTIRSHRLLQRLLETEPEELLPHFTTNGAPFLEIGRSFLAARMASELDDGRTFEELVVAADVASRLVISYAITPGAPIDLDDPEAARAFARTHLVRILQPHAP